MKLSTAMFATESAKSEKKKAEPLDTATRDKVLVSPFMEKWRKQHASELYERRSAKQEVS